MLAYLKLISNSKDLISLLRIVNVPGRKIGKSTIATIEKFAVRNKKTFIEAFYMVDEIPALGRPVKERINKFIEMISKFRDYICRP